MSKEINFLLLGESGKGKSTTLNALANYFKFGNFDEVDQFVEDTFIEVIPSHFMLPDPEKSGKGWEIVSNFTNPNERQSYGKSATSEPTGYRFTFGSESHSLRIIDTPGIGDTDGIEADMQNLEKIFLFLQTIELLHGIIIIVNGKEERHSLQFKFCIIELLTHLHKNAVSNVVFCLTHSQIVPGGIGLGSGYETLSSFLNEEHIKSVGIRLEPGKNAFFIENEVYRYLLAKKQGYQWKRVQTELSRNCWEYSVKELHQLFKQLLTQPPLDLRTTISLNNARKLVVELATPTVQLAQNIEKLNHEADKTQTEVNTAAQKQDFFKKILYSTATEVRETPIITRNIQGCHYHDPTAEFYNYFVNYRRTTNPLAFGRQRRDNVRDQLMANTPCTCRDDITYNREETTIQVLNENVQQQLNDLQREISEKNALLVDHQNSIEELRTEIVIIEDIGSKLAHFINANSTFMYNNYFETFIDVAIKEENQKSCPRTSELNALKLKHQANVKLLTEAVAANSLNSATNEEVTAEKVLELQQQLLELRHSGQHFCQVLEASQEMQANFRRTEKEVFNFTQLTSNLIKLIFEYGFGEKYF